MKVSLESVSEDKGLAVFVFLIDPSLYRPVDELVKKKLGGNEYIFKGRLMSG